MFSIQAPTVVTLCRVSCLICDLNSHRFWRAFSDSRFWCCKRAFWWNFSLSLPSWLSHRRLGRGTNARGSCLGPEKARNCLSALIQWRSKYQNILDTVKSTIGQTIWMLNKNSDIYVTALPLFLYVSLCRLFEWLFGRHLNIIIQWGSEKQTCLVFEWLKVGRFWIIPIFKSCDLTGHSNTNKIFSPVFRPPFEYQTVWRQDTNLSFVYQTSPVFKWLLKIIVLSTYLDSIAGVTDSPNLAMGLGTDVMFFSKSFLLSLIGSIAGSGVRADDGEDWKDKSLNVLYHRHFCLIKC